MRLRLLAPFAACLVLALFPASATAAGPFQFATGAHPDVAVDSAGTAHIVYDESSGSAATPDPLHYCQIPRGATACSKQITLHPPLEAIGRSSYVFVPSAGRVVIVTYRCCGTGEGNWAYQSVDGGNTFDAGRLIGNLDFEGNAVFGPGEAITGSASSTVQVMPLAGPQATATASLDSGFPVPTVGSIALFGGTTPVHVAADSDHSSFNRYTGGDPNTTAAWTPSAQLGPADSTEVRLAGGPAGLVMLEKLNDNQLFVRKFDGTSFSAPAAISEKGDLIFIDLYADPATGRFHALWINNSSPRQMRWSFSSDGVSWSAPQTVATGGLLDQDHDFNNQVAAAPDGQGWAVSDSNGDNMPLIATPLVPQPAGTAGGTPVASVTVNGTEVDFFAPSGCVKPGSKVQLRVTSKTKRRLSPKQRVKIRQVLFSLDRKTHTDRKAAFRATFPTRGRGFAKGSRHKVGAKVTLVPFKGRGRTRNVTLRGRFTICTG